MRGGTAIGKGLKIFSFVVPLVIVLDQLTKLVILKTLAPYQVIGVVPGLFNIVHYLNPGAAFGILNEGGIVRKLLLIGFSTAALVFIAAYVRKLDDRLTVLAFSLIAGGAAGNLIDRVRFGHVVDFLDFYVSSHHWPAFNVADSAITIGIALAVLTYLRSPSK